MTIMTQKDWLKLYGVPNPIDNSKFEHNNVVLWDIPDSINKAIKTLPNRLYCNKLLTPYLEKAFNTVILKGITEQIKTWDGCYNPRLIRGSKTQWSTHSFGLAIDINAAWNRLGQTPTMSKELVECFTQNGFIWGGSFSRKDGMHFELCKEEILKY